MKKIILALALATMPVVAVSNSYASEPAKTESEASQYQQVRRDYFEVTKVTDKDVYLIYRGASKPNRQPKNANKEFKLGKNRFENVELEVGDQLLMMYFVDDVFTFDHIGVVDTYRLVEEKNKIAASPEFSPLTIENKEYYYTGFESGIKRKKNDIDGKVTDEKLGELSYKKGLDAGTMDIKYGDSWYIFATEDYRYPIIPSGVYAAKYRVVAEEEDTGNFFILEFVETDEKLFEPLNLDKTYQVNVRLGDLNYQDEIMVWHNTKDLFTSDKDNIEVDKVYRNGGRDWKYSDYQVTEVHDEYIVATDLFDGSTGNVIDVYSKKLNLKVGDYVTVIEVGDYLARQYPDGNIYSEVGIADIKKTDPDRAIAISAYNNLIKSTASSDLLKKAPKSVKAIEKELKATVNESKGLLDQAFMHMLNKDKLEKDDRDQAILEMLRRVFYKKIATEEDKELALALYRNMVTTNASLKLLRDAPKAVESISEELSKEVQGSRELVVEGINELK